MVLDGIAGILFDKDGTLIDYAASWGPVNRRIALQAAAGDAALANHLLVSGGADPATGVAAADSVLAAGNTIEIAAAWVAAGAPWRPAALEVALDAEFLAAATTAVPVTDLAALFGRLNGLGLRIGIASSDSERAIRRMVAHFGLTATVEFIAGYDSGFGHKPDPGMVMAFCQATDLTAAQVMMVGDNNHDLVMGRRAGVGAVIGVLTGTGTRDSLAPLADLCLPSIAGLDVMLQNRARLPSFPG
ncbi:MAG: HAD family hydrolase [Azospirillaceae bacterium]|nr:HAD family hydrolase [Azospirillaceae bacterium]